MYAPAETITSRSARAVRADPSTSYSTPVARPESISTRRTVAPVWSSRRGRSLTGWRNASAALQRRPRFCVSCIIPAPSWEAPLKSSVARMPTSPADSTKSGASVLLQTGSATFSSPPWEWYAFWMRSLCSERLKYGRTSR